MVATKDETGPEPVHVVTMRCADLSTPVAGAIVSRCHTCEEPVWLSPSTVREAPNPRTVICLPCARPLTVKDKIKPDPLTEGQRLEIARETGLHGDALDRAIDSVVKHLTSPAANAPGRNAPLPG